MLLRGKGFWAWSHLTGLELVEGMWSSFIDVCRCRAVSAVGKHALYLGLDLAIGSEETKVTFQFADKAALAMASLHDNAKSNTLLAADNKL